MWHSKSHFVIFPLGPVVHFHLSFATPLDPHPRHLQTVSKMARWVLLLCSVSWTEAVPENIDKPQVSVLCRDGVPTSHVQKTTLHQVWIRFSPVFCYTFIAAYVASVIDCWMKLDMWKKDKHSGSCTGCMPFAQLGHFLSGGFFKRACAAVPAKGSTVGQLPIELQPLCCGGVGQIRPHNCLPSQTGTAASLHLSKPATDCCSFREPSVRNK